jgi:hypothetical protein
MRHPCFRGWPERQSGGADLDSMVRGSFAMIASVHVAKANLMDIGIGLARPRYCDRSAIALSRRKPHDTTLGTHRHLHPATVSLPTPSRQRQPFVCALAFVELKKPPS